MNCKPGDLAIVVGHTAPDTAWALGLVIHIGSASHIFPNCWTSVPDTFDPFDGRRMHFDDEHLRPINNPGDDARDNAWDWLPAVPTKELA